MQRLQLKDKLQRFAQLLKNADMTKIDTQLQLHVGYPVFHRTGDIVLTQRPGTDEVYALVIGTHGKVASIQEFTPGMDLHMALDATEQSLEEVISYWSEAQRLGMTEELD